MTILEHQETRLLHAHQASQLKWPIHPHHAGPYSNTEPLLYTDPVMHHKMSVSQKHHQDIFSLARSFPNDPATKVSTFDVIPNNILNWPILSIKDFIPRLKDHLLGQLHD